MADQPTHLTLYRHPTRRVTPYGWRCQLCGSSRSAGDTSEEARRAFYRDHVPTDAHQRKLRQWQAADGVLDEQAAMREEAGRGADS